MNAARRIANLHRELADAYDALADELAERRAKRKRVAPETDPHGTPRQFDPALEASVRNGLRRAGAKL